MNPDHKEQPKPEGFWTNADIISRYTREQAIDDGVLIDVSEAAKAEFFLYPVAFTAEVYQTAVRDHAEGKGMDELERLHEVLDFIRQAIAHTPRGYDRLPLTIPTATREGGGYFYDFVAHCGPGDRGEPVITVMERGQD